MFMVRPPSWSDERSRARRDGLCALEESETSSTRPPAGDHAGDHVGRCVGQKRRVDLPVIAVLEVRARAAGRRETAAHGRFGAGAGGAVAIT
jgi:hypothetical protein